MRVIYIFLMFLVVFLLDIADGFTSSRKIEEFTLKEDIPTCFEKEIGDNADSYLDFLNQVGVAGGILEKILPENLKKSISDLDSKNGADLIVVHNFPVDSKIPPTPEDSKRPPSKYSCISLEECRRAKGFVSEAAILGVAHLLRAKPYYAATEKDGTIINQIVSLEGRKYKAQASSYGSSLELLPHTENVYQIPPLKYFSLLCLRGDPKVATSIIFVKDIFDALKKKYPMEYKNIFKTMSKPLFIMSAGPSHDKKIAKSILPILELGEDGDFLFRLNLNEGRTVGINKEARKTVKILRNLITSDWFKKNYFYKIHLNKGDYILFNNWKVMHARDAFEIDPKNRRWLQRCYMEKN